MRTRSALAATLLSLFIPLYLYYWFYDVSKELKRLKSNPPSLWLIFGPFVGLLFITVFLLFGSMSDAMKVFGNILSILVGIPTVMGLVVGPIVYMYQFSEASDKATKSKAGKLVCFVLFLFVSPAAVYIIQETLNMKQKAKH